MRRRHYGPRGKARFAQLLGLSLEEYARYERGVLPPGEVMVRMCEVTGEDLQWLLTGVDSRGTVVIAGARGRHRDVLARLAKLLDEQPQLATAVEAFLELLIQGERARTQEPPKLPGPKAEDLIPILEPDELPQALPEGAADGPGAFYLARLEEMTPAAEHVQAALVEPAMQYAPQADRRVKLLTLQAADGRTGRYIHSPAVARCFPGAFGVRLADDTMRPMFQAGDAAVVALGVEPKIGRPALCRVANEPGARCRVWLGGGDGVVHLGRLTDGEVERVADESLLWSLEVLYRLAPAA